MRRTASPFITEYKSRSSKSSAAHSPNIDGADKHDPTPSFLDHGVFVTSYSKTEDAYQVALKAADALFGRGNSAIPRQEHVPSSNVRLGRVLPSLIGDDDASTFRSVNDGKKIRRGRKVSTAKEPSSTGLEKLRLEPRKAVEPDAVTEPVEEVSASHRERSSIQKRWVLRTELKSGQKWKRRFCKAAR